MREIQQRRPRSQSLSGESTYCNSLLSTNSIPPSPSLSSLSCRQLEAIVRISESLAKMSLLPFAIESHVDEALRLFQVSTMDAALSGNLSGTHTHTLSVSVLICVCVCVVCVCVCCRC